MSTLHKVERDLARLTAVFTIRVDDANNEHDSTINTIIKSLDRKATQRKQAHMKLRNEYLKKKITPKQRDMAIEFIKGQLDTDLARVKAESQRHVDRAASKPVPV
ncbi:hypothetical protein BGX20_008655 [Mortierella sp. AD010]|nr:hypothetical protein BGX20_008655 [Mortierella sp. AD010]